MLLAKYYKEFESQTFIPTPQNIKKGVVKILGKKSQGIRCSKFLLRVTPH